MLRENPSDDGETPRPTTPSDDHAPGDSKAQPTTRERSTEQPPGTGLKGAGRSRIAWSSPAALFTAGGAESREYPPERPRATGGFLNRLNSISSDSHPSESAVRGPEDETPESKYNSKRAQTSIDFVVGASVFLLTVAFVVAFLPGVFEPFTASGEGDVVTSDRTASLLAEQLLVEPTNPGVLNATCTAEFFSESDDGMRSACGLSADAADLDAALGLGATTSVNVTVEENGIVRSTGGVTLRAGPEPPTNQGVVVSRRVVVLDGEERDLYVRVW